MRSTSSQALSQVFKAACLSDVSNDINDGATPALLPVLVQALAKQLAKDCEEEDDDVENRHGIPDALSEILWDAYKHKALNGVRVAQIYVADAREITRNLMSLISSCLAHCSTLISDILNCSFDDQDELTRTRSEQMQSQNT